MTLKLKYYRGNDKLKYYLFQTNENSQGNESTI